MKKLLLSILLFNLLCFSSEEHNELQIGLGYNQVSFNEKESSIEFDDDDLKQPAESGSLSVISLNASYGILNFSKQTLFVNGVFPLVNSGDENYYQGSISIKHYFKNLNTIKNYDFPDGNLTISPRFRYYLGLETGVAYMVYITTNAKKDDTSFLLRALGGASYMFTQKMGVDVEAGYGRATGSITSSALLSGSLSLVLFI